MYYWYNIILYYMFNSHYITTYYITISYHHIILHNIYIHIYIYIIVYSISDRIFYYNILLIHLASCLIPSFPCFFSVPDLLLECLYTAARSSEGRWISADGWRGFNGDWMGHFDVNFMGIYNQWIGLGENFNRKTPYFMVKTMVSCIFSLKPIHWYNQQWTIDNNYNERFFRCPPFNPITRAVGVFQPLKRKGTRRCHGELIFGYLT